MYAFAAETYVVCGKCICRSPSLVVTTFLTELQQSVCNTHSAWLYVIECTL